MKRLLIILLIPALLLLSGCVSSEAVSEAVAQILPDSAAAEVYKRFPSLRPQDIPENALVVYRIASGDSSGGELIRPEVLENPGETGSELDLLMDAFASPAREDGLSCALPEGVTIESISRKDGVMTLLLSPDYLAMPAMDRTAAAFCAVLTFCAVDGVDAVSIRSDGHTVFSGLMPEDALLTDTVDDPYVRQLRLYFSDADGRYLISEYHSLTLNEETSPERYVVEELLRGPYSTDLKSAIPNGTMLLSCVTEEGICKVDLSSDFYEQRPVTPAGERLAIYSLVNSLTALSGVDSVRILIEGQPVSRYGYRSFAEPLMWYGEVIGPVSEAKGEFDADLYLPLPGRSAVAALPFRVREEDYTSRAEAVLGALLSAEEPGYHQIPHSSGSVLGFDLQDGVCMIDLAESFFASLPENERYTAVQSMVASLCALPDISAVCFTMNGEEAVFDGRDWSGPWAFSDNEMNETEVY